LWEQRINKGVFDMFQTLADTLKDSKPEQAFSDLVSSHLRVLFQALFSKRNKPSSCKEMDPWSICFQTRWIDLTCTTRRPTAGHCKMVVWIFHTTTLPRFWLKILPEYPDLAIKALKTLLLFPTSYLCGSGFSVMVAINTKPRNSLDVWATLRVPLSSILSRWERLVAAKQA